MKRATRSKPVTDSKPVDIGEVKESAVKLLEVIKKLNKSNEPLYRDIDGLISLVSDYRGNVSKKAAGN